MRDIFYTDINSRFVKIIFNHHFDFIKKEENIEKNFRIKFGKGVTTFKFIFLTEKKFDYSLNEKIKTNDKLHINTNPPRHKNK